MIKLSFKDWLRCGEETGWINSVKISMDLVPGVEESLRVNRAPAASGAPGTSSSGSASKGATDYLLEGTALYMLWQLISGKDKSFNDVLFDGIKYKGRPINAEILNSMPGDKKKKILKSIFKKHPGLKEQLENSAKKHKPYRKLLGQSSKIRSFLGKFLKKGVLPAGIFMGAYLGSNYAYDKLFKDKIIGSNVLKQDPTIMNRLKSYRYGLTIMAFAAMQKHVMGISADLDVKISEAFNTIKEIDKQINNKIS